MSIPSFTILSLPSIARSATDGSPLSSTDKSNGNCQKK
jgi:hypothetical protein